MKRASPFEEPGITLDTNGWPTGYGANPYVESFFAQDNTVVGDFVITWDGPANAFANGWLEPGYADLVSESGNRAVINLDMAGTNAAIRFKPGAPTQITNVKIAPVAQESLLNAASPFSPQYVQYARASRVLRFMDLGGTNFSPVTSWANRPKPTDRIQSRQRGVALESLIQLANEAQRDAWFCIPYQADDNYVLQAATLIRNTLGTGLKVYIEYSNEHWNGIFPIWNHINQQGNQGTQLIPGDSVQSAFAYYAKRSAEIFDIFYGVFGAQASSRLVRVYGGQYVNPYVAGVGLGWMQANGGVKADVYAIAPYFDGTALHPNDTGGTSLSGLANYPDWTFNNWIADPVKQAQWETYVLGLSNSQVLDAIEYEIENVQPTLLQNSVNLANQYGLTTVAYEGGSHLRSDLYSNANRVAIMQKFNDCRNDPRWGVLIGDYLTGWKTRTNNGLFCWFTMSGKSGSTQSDVYGSWGLISFNPSDVYAGSPGPSWAPVNAWITANPKP